MIILFINRFEKTAFSGKKLTDRSMHHLRFQLILLANIT